MIEDESLRVVNKILIRTLRDEQNLFIAFQIKDKNLQAEQTFLDAPQ
jgi:hypothetical protein